MTNSRTMTRTTIPGMLALAIFALMASGCTYTQVASSPPQDVQYEPEPYYAAGYYDGPFVELSMHGAWLETARFGWAWRPYAHFGWQPYDHGHWAWTRWGWTWVSYEPFGWATYHYGFWHYDPVYGWIWIPDDQWFPARVSWMFYGDYVLWAPIPPPGYYIADPWDIHVDFIWVGVHLDHFARHNVGRYKIRGTRHVWRNVPRLDVRREAPTVTRIETRTKIKIRTVDVDMQKFTKGGKQYDRMVLPPEERETVRRYEKRVTEEVLRPQVRPQSGGKATATKKERPVAGEKQGDAKQGETKKPQKKEEAPASKKGKEEGKGKAEPSKDKKGEGKAEPSKDKKGKGKG